MSHTPNPPRWLDQIEDLPDDFARELAEYTELGPTPEQHERVFAAVEQRAQLESNSKAGGGQSSSLGMKLAVLGLTALLGIVLWSSRGAPVARPKPPVATPAVIAPAQTSVASTPAAATPAVDAGPPVVEVMPPRKLSVRAKKPSAPTTETARVDPVAELSLLSRARRLLATSPARALDLADEHARIYPSGLLSEEREVIAIEALVRSSRLADASSRARAFEKAHPHSAHLERIHVILESP